MTLLRKWLLAAMTALVLAAPLAVVSPARADTFDATGQTQYYYLYIRADANSAWEVTVHPFSQAQLRCGLFHSISAWSSRAAPDAESVML